MGRTRSTLEANLVNCGANSVICGANFNGANAPINSKLQHPPPPGIPRAFDCVSCPGRGEFEHCVARVGNLNPICLFFWHNTPWVFFSFCKVWRIYKIEFRLCQWITLSKESLKEVWRRYYGISLWKACKVCDWRRNLSLSRGISVLNGGAFERLFCPEGRGEFA